MTEGLYRVSVQDEAGCIAREEITIVAQPNPVSWSNPSPVSATCSVAANGSIVLTGLRHSENKALTYFLNEESVSGSDEEVTAFFENLVPGVYTVKVGDSDGCYVEQNVTVGSNDKLPQLSFHEEESVVCAGKYTGRVSVTIDNFDSNLSPYDVTAAVTVLEAGDDELEQPLVERVSESGFIISNLTDTTYTISVRDAFGCSSEEEYTPSLLEPALSLSETWIDAPCANVMGTIIMSAEGGVPDEGNYGFWFGDDFIGNGSEFTISRASDVVGQVKVIDSAGCEVVGVENRSVLLRDNPVEIGRAGSVSPACIGGDDGSIVFEIQGDSELAYSYFLFNRANPTEVLTGPITDEIPGRVSIEGLSAGVYDLMVVEAPLDSDSSEEDMRAGCWSEYNGIEVEDYDTIVVESFSNNYIEYFGDESGSMEVTITGGSQSYEYRIVNADDESYVFGSGEIGEGRFQKDGLPAGNYLFLFKDVNNCAYFEGGAIWDEHPFTIAQPDEALTLEVRLEDDLLCYESEDGRIEVEARGGWGPHYTYKLEGPVDFDWQQEGVFESLPAGTYSLFIKDSREVEHVFDNEFTLTQPAPFSVEVTRTKDATCPGYNNGELDVVSTNGVYSGDGLIYRVFDTGREEVVAINGGAEWHYNKLSEGTYSIVVSDENQCADSASFSIGEPEQVEIDIEHNYIRAKNHATGEVSFEISKGNGYYEYTWGLEEAERPIASGTTEGALNFDGLFAGNYVLMVRDTARCHFEGDSEWMVRSILMREPELELGIEVLVDSVTCNGLGDGELALSGLGGWGSYVYSFEGAPFSSQPSIDNLEPGTYNIAVRDSAGIIYERSVEVFEPEVLAVDDVASLTHVSCFGGSNGKIALNVTGGNNAYLVSTDQLFWQEGTEVQNLPAGAFNVFVKDVKGCETSGGPFTLTEPSKIALDTHFVEESTCNLAEGSISASFKGGVGQYTYTWYKELLLSDGTFDTDTLTEFTSSSINKLYAGRYIVDVQDENGCEVSFPFDVNDNTDLTILTIDTYPVSCYGYNDGAAKAEIAFGNPPYNLTWRGQGLEVLQDSASNFSAGEHHLSVYDDKGCYVSQYFVIGTPDSLFYQITEQVQPLCLGGAKGSIEIAGTGGTAPYRFEWDNGTQAAALGSIDPGTYRVVMTDSHDCVSSFDFDFDYQRIVQPFVGRDTLICHYNTLMLDGGDYARFAWHATSGFTSTNRLVEVNQPATYFLEVADGDNCIGFDSITVDVSVLEITGVSTKDLSCAGLANGEASITINSTSDNYNVQWPGGSNGMSVSGYSGGDYTVSAINEFGCSDTLHFSLFEPEPLSITASYNEPLCLGVSDGYIRPVVSGGVGDYRYSWSTGESKRELSRLSQGVYVFTVTDANDCWLSDEYNLVYKRILLPDLGGDKVVCQGNSVSLNPGSFHKLSWYHDEEFASTDSVFDAHLPGSYVVVVNDEDNCIGRDSVHVDVLGAALLPSFLMATSVPLGDTLLIVEVTQPKPKSIDWEIGGSHRIVERGEYFAKVIFDEEGVFPVTLSSYADEGCMGQERKSILVTSASPQNEQGENVYQQQNLISLEVSPNPSQGEFNALVKMHEAAPVTFYLVRIDTGQIYETRKRQGLAEYNELFTHNGVGQFVVFVESAGERLMQKIIVF